MSPKILATYRGKMIDQREANSCVDRNGLARRRESEASGFESQCQQRCVFLVKSPLNHVFVELIQYVSVSCVMYSLSCV